MEKNGHIKLQSIANILLINIQHIDKPWSLEWKNGSHLILLSLWKIR